MVQVRQRDPVWGYERENNTGDCCSFLFQEERLLQWNPELL